jgi:hypothetical protein
MTPPQSPLQPVANFKNIVFFEMKCFEQIENLLVKMLKTKMDGLDVQLDDAPEDFTRQTSCPLFSKIQHRFLISPTSPSSKRPVSLIVDRSQVIRTFNPVVLSNLLKFRFT